MSAKIPFFSVIITSYNRSARLKQCIESVLQQTYRDYELIVVDDCSTDETATVALGYQNALRFFSTATNAGGPAIPRNIGIKQARGKWLCFCDSDDSFLPNHLGDYFQFIQSGKLDDGIVSSNAVLMKHDRITDETYFKNSGSGFKELQLLCNWDSNHAVLSSLCIRNENVIPFREDKAYHSVEDYVFLLENMINHKRHFATDNPTVIYNHQSTDSIRRVKGNGNRIYLYKRQLFHQYHLAERAGGLLMRIIFLRDYLKYRLHGLKKITSSE